MPPPLKLLAKPSSVIVGSQAILGSYPDASEALLRSQEVNLYPRRAPDKAIKIEGALGDGSQFQQTFGYYAHAVGPETAKAPTGWEDRLVVVDIPPRPANGVPAFAFCLDPHDLVLSKLAANREREWEFAKEALSADLVDADVLLKRVDDLPVKATLLESIKGSLKSLLGGSR